MPRSLVAVLAVAVALTAYGEDDEQAERPDEQPAVQEAERPGEISAQDARDFATWYRMAAREGGDEPAISVSVARRLIRRLCAYDAEDTAARHAAAEEVKDEFFGDASFAASGIVLARQACGQDPDDGSLAVAAGREP